MRLARIGIGVAGIFALFASTARAEIYFISQEQAEPSVSGEIVVQKDVVQNQVIQKDVVQNQSIVQKADVCGSDIVCSDPCGGCCDPCGSCACDPCCCPAPWELCPRTCRGFKLGGWVQAGYHTEGANGFGTGMFNDYPNTGQLHQAYLFAEKAAQTCGCGYDWGFRFDYVYGTDGQDAQAFGSEPGNWDTSWDGGNYYGHAIPQAYLEFAYNNFSVKAGHFYSLLGHERVPAVQNFFYSHAFSMLLPTPSAGVMGAQAKNTVVPYTHTGFLTEYSPNCQLTLYGGWTAGWDSGFDQFGGGDTFLGGISYAFSDCLSVDYSAIMGDFGSTDLNGVARTSDSNGYLHSIVLDWDINRRLNYVFQTNYGDNGAWYTNAAGAGGNGKVFSLNNYLLYTLNCRWAVGTRLEWLKMAGTDEYAAVTVGANYRPCANVILRPEIRIDEFDGVGLEDQSAFGIDAIITF